MSVQKTLFRILVIEDDLDLAYLLKKFLESKSFIVKVARTGTKGLREINRNKYDLFLIDIGLPEVNGLTLLKELRNKSFKPVIVITDKTEIDNEVKAFNLGTNIFHKKPINFQLLYSQISSFSHAMSRKVKRKDLTIDLSKRVFLKKGKEYKLTYGEFKLLEFVLNSNGRIFTRNDVIRSIFDNNKEVELGAVDTLISRLRKKITDEKNGFIETVYKTGYRLSGEYASN